MFYRVFSGCAQGYLSLCVDLLLHAHVHCVHRQPLESVRSAAVEILTPLFRACVEAAESQLLTMHTEGATPPKVAGKPGASGSMQGLVRLLAQWRCVGVIACMLVAWFLICALWSRSTCCCRVDYVTRFTPLPSPTAASVAAALVERLAARIVYFFVRHAALKRPLTPEGIDQLGRVRVCCAS